MKRPLFSCVIPVKGPRPFFDEALQSLYAQGLGGDLEIIVQDADVGSGGVGELAVGELNHERHERHENGSGVRGQELAVSEGGLEAIRWYREVDKGQSDALNKGFAKAKGEWLFWLNADDVLLPGALKKVAECVKRKRDCNWIAGNTVYLNADGKVLGVRTDARWHPWYGRYLSVWTGGPSAFFRHSLWDRDSGFDNSFRYMMDIDLWTRWAKSGVRFVGLADYIWGFRVHSASQTAGDGDKTEHRNERSRLYVKHGLFAQSLWRNITRIVTFFDKSWWKRISDSRIFSGMHWQDIG